MKKRNTDKRQCQRQSQWLFSQICFYVHFRSRFYCRKKATGTDSKFFSTNRKGENHELREELRSPQRDRKKDAVKKVIANMTIGKDVSTLFTDVINCIQTGKLSINVFL